MNVYVLGAGLMGRTIVYDLCHHASFDQVFLLDANQTRLDEAQELLSNCNVKYKQVDVTNNSMMKQELHDASVLISAVPYMYNVELTKLAIETGCHFIDLGGNNDVVQKQRSLHEKAITQQVTIIPDSGLAPGLVSIITKAIVEGYDRVHSVRLRVGGLPKNPRPPLEYQLVFSPNGLINEYLEDAIVLDHGKIRSVPSLTDLENIHFSKPFEQMEAFITSGGCSTLPATYQHRIGYLDYKTIRYPGHCTKMKTMLDLGLGNTYPITIDETSVVPRDVLIELLKKSLPSTGEDVVLLKVIADVEKENKRWLVEYEMIDWFDNKTSLSAMMRTTGFPVAITADFLEKGIINTSGVYCPEEIIPPALMFEELEKRNIHFTISQKPYKEDC